MQATAIILAGGKSSRMGRNKALLEIGGRTVIEMIANELQDLTSHIMIVTNSPEEYHFLHLPIVEDEWKGMGPLAGIHAGLSHSKTEKNLIVACDMPFISAVVGRILLEELEDGFQVVIPDMEGQLHPLYAAYHKNILPWITQSMNRQQLSIHRFLENMPVKIMNEGDFMSSHYILKDTDFFNMNNRHAFLHALNIYKGSEGISFPESNGS